MIFTEGIDGLLGSYSVSCLKCHTVGYDTNASSYADNGFYATQLIDNWTFPTVLSTTNFASMPASLQNLANIQCENCHGPGSAHAYAFGNTNAPRLAAARGHDHPRAIATNAMTPPRHHVYGTEWYASSHAVTTTIPTGSGRDQCVICHTAYGFITRIETPVQPHGLRSDQSRPTRLTRPSAARPATSRTETPSRRTIRT